MAQPAPERAVGTGQKQRWALDVQRRAGNAALVQWGVQRWSAPDTGKAAKGEPPTDESSEPEKSVDGAGADEAKEVGPAAASTTVVWNQGVAYAGAVDPPVKYTMFLPDGTPVRATASVKLKEASKLTSKKEG